MEVDDVTQVIAKAAEEIRAVAGPNNQTRPLSTYYRIGEIIRDLKVPWGSNKHREIDKMLKVAGVVGLGDSNLHKADKFAKNWKRRLVLKLEKAGVSWRAADRLCSKNLTEEQQEQLLRDVLSGQLEPRNLGNKISKRSGVKAKRSTRSIETAIQRANKEIEFLVGTLRGRGVDEDSRFKAEHAVREIAKLIALKLA